MTATAARAARATENADPATFAAPDLDCDIVMKGGITSGVVYPGAVLRLARRYRFRSIGGTSAGAIAAVIVAAAERNRAGGGFTRVAELPGRLASTPDGRPFMLQLFQPDPATRPLFRALVGFLQHGAAGGALRVLGAFWFGPLVALALAVTAILASTAGGADPVVAVGGVALAVALGVAVLALDVRRAVRQLPGNDFGLCRLGPQAGTADRPALTAWLHGEIQAVGGAAGGPPLTFADLWGVPAPATADPDADAERHALLLRSSRTPGERAVDLQMVTTDLTYGRPIRLPVPYQAHHDRLEDEAGRLLFDPGELARFFPADVIAHLRRFARPLGDSAGEVAGLAGGRTLLNFPIGPDLPVLVAARMSLSFPFLIAAVPLWRVEYGRDERVHLQRVLFSDGGVTSNFPIHFFDSPLPTRPTFGLHLTDFEPGETPDLDDPVQAVDPPPDPSGRAPQPPRPITSLGAFAGALKNAAQNWRDNAQASLPGFRDRVTHIKLGPGEGGLNLVMPPHVVTRLDDRGDRAGELLVERFAGPEGAGPARHWNDHRFTRYRTTMALAERWLRSYHRGYTSAPTDAVTIPYAERVEAGLEKPYRFGSLELRDTALRRSAQYTAMVERWQDEPSLDDDRVPRPPSALRTVPPV